MCRKKRRYRTEFDARMALLRCEDLRYRGRRNRRECRAYYCPNCQAWHLTSKRQPKEERQ